ncbi:MAG TPA: hypothetical protein VN310_09655 [Candidatus Dormibacteraeota bacterium]|jgi:hypothetical protein|nr:hypothetical protein [Candidatus Dormibacteraeota bacterium]
MKRLRSILVTIVVTLTAIFVCLYWIAPIALSFYAARKVLPVARVVPTDLKDHSVSQAPGTKLSYFGYEFEVPWSDLDEAKTAHYPKDKPEKTRVVLSFRSGLRLVVTAVPAREAVSFCATEFKIQPPGVELLFGPGASTSDYAFVSNVYRFTPDKMHYWSLSPRLHAREQMVLLTKSIMPVKAANSGIFNLQNQYYRGFQQGDPRVSRDGVVINLYSDEGDFEMIFLEKDYTHSAAVTQPEINRIVQSLRKAAPGEVASSAGTEIKSMPRLR